MKFPRTSVALVLSCLIWTLACRANPAPSEPRLLEYVGSSTVALFVREAGNALPGFEFEIDTEPESDGGERAMLEGRADLAGLAREPTEEVLASGVAAAMIGRDSLAVIVPQELPIEALSHDQLRGIYSGNITDWSDLGGPELTVVPFLVGPDSATRRIFGEQVMVDEDYANCTVVEPDSRIVREVASTPGGIGFISFAFLNSGSPRVRALAVDGQEPSSTNFQYPISRPLYLLWRPGTPGADDFVQWATSPAGQSIVQRHYSGVRVLGSVDTSPESQAFGTLVVTTRTFLVVDGDIHYYPHQPYVISSERGDELRRVRNHRGVNDENPMRVHLPPGRYLIRTEGRSGEPLEFYAAVQAGRTTEVRASDFER